MIKKENGIEYEIIKAKKESELNLLFVHGSGCNKNFLKALAELFEEYNCYLIDLPGHGNSENTGYNIDNYVKSISYLANKLSNVVLIGHSLGGTLVAKTASLNLKSVKGAVILNSGASYPTIDKSFMNKIRQGIIDLEYLLEACGHMDNQDVQEAIKSMDPAASCIVDFLIDDCVDISSSLKYIKIPTLIFGGEDEILVIPEYVEKLHKLIKKSKLIMLPRGRHMVCVAEKYKVKEIICDFIDKKIVNKNILKEKEIIQSV